MSGIQLIISYSFFPISNQWNEKSHTPGEKDDTAREPEGIIVRQALQDEKDSAYQK